MSAAGDVRFGPWRTIKGDGTDRLPPMWISYEARLRNGRIWTDLAVTNFCLQCGENFAHLGKDWDVMAIREALG